MESSQTFGMTSAINTAAPKESEIMLSKVLEEYLRESGMFESDAELNHRFEVLGKLNNLVKEWIKDVSLNVKHMPPQVAETVGGKICTFGSFRLGVAGKGADIDALCVAPRHIERSDYFSTFYDLLKKQPEVTEMRAVEEAYVPVIKMKYEGIEIDMLFARLALKEVPEDVDLKDDKILKNLDEKCVRSLNGCRVTDEILRQVPNRETFKLALRAIKLWAKRHGVYSNVLGYLGGVSWAMLVARTCQLYPNASASIIVEKLFLVFSKWSWPAPVYLKQPYDAKLLFKVWDPRLNIQDRFHLMPIITPAYPQQNSTFNISQSTKVILVEAFKTSLEITQKIISEKGCWEPLFTPPNFFGKYKHFLVVLAVAKTSEDFLEWYGLVESKIRRLIASLEHNSAIKTIHINPTYFTTHDEEYKERPHAAWFIGIDFKKSESANIDLTSDINKFVEVVYVMSTYNKAYKEGMEVNCKYVKRKQLSNYLPQETIDKYKGNKEESIPSSIAVKRKSTDGCVTLSSEHSADVKKLKVIQDYAQDPMRNGGDAHNPIDVTHDGTHDDPIPIITINDDISSTVNQLEDQDVTTTGISDKPRLFKPVDSVCDFDHVDGCTNPYLDSSLRCHQCYNNASRNAITHSTPSHTNPVSHFSPESLLNSAASHHLPLNVQSFHPMLISQGVSLQPHFSPVISSNFIPLIHCQQPVAHRFADGCQPSNGFKSHVQSYADYGDAPQSKTQPSMPYYMAALGNPPPVYPQYGIYSLCPSPSLVGHPSSPLRNVCCVNTVTNSMMESESHLNCLSPLSPRRFPSSYNDQCFSTPPRSLKRTSSQLNLSPSVSSTTPCSYKSSPCYRPSNYSQNNSTIERQGTHPNGTIDSQRIQTNNTRERHRSHNQPRTVKYGFSSSNKSPPAKNKASNLNTASQSKSFFSKMNKPPALVLARQRLPSREIPDVLTPNTPKLVSPGAQRPHFHLSLK